MDSLLSIITNVGILCTILSIFFLFRYTHIKTFQTKKGLFLRILALVISIVITVSGLVCRSVFYPQGDFYWTIDEAVAEFPPPFTEYEIFDRIDTDLNPTPIIMVYENTPKSTSLDTEDNIPLVILLIKTEEWLERTRYRVSSNFLLVNTWISNNGEVTELINENAVNIVDEFPGIWFGVIYPDKRDKIQINGKKPELHDFNFMGTDYVFWYIARDDSEPTLSFEE